MDADEICKTSSAPASASETRMGHRVRHCCSAEPCQGVPRLAAALDLQDLPRGQGNPSYADTQLQKPVAQGCLADT